MNARPVLSSPALYFAALASVVVLLSAQAAGAAADGREDMLRSPARIASMAGGPLLVTDYAAGTVCMLQRNTLQTLRCFAIKGRPLGIAWSPGRIYVGNESTGTVEAYTPGGKLLFRFIGEGAVRSPGSIAVDERSSRLFVVDGLEKNIKVFGLDGALLATLTGDTAGNGMLVNPVAVAVDPLRGELLVSDYGDPAALFPARIRIYDRAGNFITAISGRTGGFSRPQGLAVNGDLIFVADAMLGQVLVFDRTTLSRARTLGSFGTEQGQLMLPLDVLVDPASGDVFVTNNRPGRIERFEKGGLEP